MSPFLNAPLCLVYEIYSSYITVWHFSASKFWSPSTAEILKGIDENKKILAWFWLVDSGLFFIRLQSFYGKVDFLRKEHIFTWLYLASYSHFLYSVFGKVIAFNEAFKTFLNPKANKGHFYGRNWENPKNYGFSLHFSLFFLFFLTIKEVLSKS